MSYQFLTSSETNGKNITMYLIAQLNVKETTLTMTKNVDNLI